MKEPNYITPVIIIGSHRSGTSMISKFLEDMGIFMGVKKDINNESVFFQDINNWILNTSSATWDSPDNIKYLLNNNEILDLTIDYIKKIINSPHIINFLGLYKYIFNGSLTKLSFPWGWKDPRNSYTLPIWLKIFPQAKIIHVYRHGIDVANSLMKRQISSVEKSRKLHLNRNFLYNIKKKKGGFADSILCNDLEECFNLWEKYINISFKYENIYNENYSNIKYEDFLLDPEHHLLKILEFLDLEADSKKIVKIIKKVNKDRAYAYKYSANLLKFEKKVINILRKYSY